MGLSCGRDHGEALDPAEAVILDELHRLGVDGLEVCLPYFHAKFARCEPCRGHALDVAAGDVPLAVRHWYVFELIARVHFQNADAVTVMAAKVPELTEPAVAVDDRLTEHFGDGDASPQEYFQVLAEVLGTMELPERRVALDRWSALAASGEDEEMRGVVARVFDSPGLEVHRNPL